MTLEEIRDHLIHLNKDGVYLLFVDPEKISIRDLDRHLESTAPEDMPNIMIVASKDGHTPVYVESVNYIKDWISASEGAE